MMNSFLNAPQQQNKFALRRFVLVMVIIPLLLSMSSGKIVAETSTPGQITIVGQKVLMRNEIRHYTFSFDIAGGDAVTQNAITNGDIVINATRVTNNTAGQFRFDNIKFYKEGSYLFHISESAENPEERIAYDSHIATVNVDVVYDNGSDSYIASITSSTGLTFTNYYIPMTTYAGFFGFKILSGKDIEVGEFTFDIQPVGNSQIPNDLVVHNTIDGNTPVILFLSYLKFTETGVHKYILTERNEGKPGYKYDNSVYEITITVTLRTSDYVLSCETEYIKVGEGEVQTVVFRNEFLSNTYNELEVIYKDGANETVFTDVSFTVDAGSATPLFNGGNKPTRTGYEFVEWGPSWSPVVTQSVTYVAKWKKNNPRTGVANGTNYYLAIAGGAAVIGGLAYFTLNKKNKKADGNLK